MARRKPPYGRFLHLCITKGRDMHSFTPLVMVFDGEPLASSEVIARGMKAQHASTIKLVRKHSEALARFGLVRFEI